VKKVTIPCVESFVDMEGLVEFREDLKNGLDLEKPFSSMDNGTNSM